MNPLDAPTNPETNSADGPSLEKGRSDVGETIASEPTLRWGLPLIGLALGAGLLAGVGSWLIGEATVTAFNPPRTKYEMMGQTLFKARFEDQLSADAKNAALAFTLLGGVLGLALGVAGGLAQHSVHAALKAGVVGLVLGGLAGCASSLAVLPLYYRAVEQSPEEMSHDIILPFLVHAAIWSTSGLAGGLAFGIGLGAGRRRVYSAAIGGLIGAALGAILYETVGAMMFPAGKTTLPISLTWETRLLARLLVAGLSGLLAAAITSMPDRTRAELKSSS
jgi:hypothetical protein